MGMNRMRALVAPVTCVTVLTATALLALTGCGNGGIRGFSPEDTDYFMTAGVTDGSVGVLVTDARCREISGTASLDMTVEVEFLAIDGGAGTVPPSSQLNQFRLLRYVVTYQNASVPGGPVPPPLTVQTPFVESVPAEFELTGWPILTAAQKGSPPLSTPSTSLPSGQVLYSATITFFGAPIHDLANEIATSFSVDLTVLDSCHTPIVVSEDPLVTMCPTPLADPLSGTTCA